MKTYLEGYTEWTSVQQMGAESANDSSDFLTLPLLSATSSLSLRPPSLRCPCALRSRSVFFFPSISNLSPVPEDPSLSSRCFLISLVQNTSCLHPPHVAVGTPFFFSFFFQSAASIWRHLLAMCCRRGQGHLPSNRHYCHYSSPSGCTSRI